MMPNHEIADQLDALSRRLDPFSAARLANRYPPQAVNFSNPIDYQYSHSYNPRWNDHQNFLWHNQYSTNYSNTSHGFYQQSNNLPFDYSSNYYNHPPVDYSSTTQNFYTADQYQSTQYSPEFDEKFTFLSKR